MKKLFFSIGFWAAAFISYAKWHSFWWAVLHAFMGWIYIVYWTIEYSPAAAWFR